jgi:Protein of unknown function (DUF2628)
MEVKEEELNLFAGDKDNYYLKKWKKMEESGKTIDWNWGACLFQTVWMGYRKMYLYAAVNIGLLAYIDVVLIPSLHPLIQLGVYIFIGILFGIFGNRLYHKHSKKKISVIKSDQPDPEIQKIEIAKAGGTSWIGVCLVFIGIYFAVSVIIQFST